MSARSGPDGHLPCGFKLPLQPLLHEHIRLHLPEPAARILHERRPVLLLFLSKSSTGNVNKPHNLCYQLYQLNKDLRICQGNRFFCCEILSTWLSYCNLLFWHFAVCSRDEVGIPASWQEGRSRIDIHLRAVFERIQAILRYEKTRSQNKQLCNWEMVSNIAGSEMNIKKKNYFKILHFLKKSTLWQTIIFF